MQFNSPTFLFLFLPFCLILYFIADRRFKNLVALIASLVFFAWGQTENLFIILGLIVINFALGRIIESKRDQPGGDQLYLILGIGLNLVLLIFYKTAAAYVQYVPTGLFQVQMPGMFDLAQKVSIPLGVSYITFQTIGYLLDIHNEVHDSEKSFLNFALFILLFPKLITGPITRYRDIGDALSDREISIAGTVNGVRRFILGLAKKALIADQLARIVNPAFALDTPSFTTGIAWLVVVGYALQLYFDFSGYTDMAIGLGQMLGFRYVENFNYPYISRSIGEFWRRWHISLSSWFRDYVFYPLEFASRRAGGRFRQQVNILIVFLLTGLWHGFTLNFIIWGVIHGLAIALEMTVFGRWLKKVWTPLAHLYSLAVILLGWVFFRSPTPVFAFQLLDRLGGSRQGVEVIPFSMTQPLPIIENSIWLALALGIFLSIPVISVIQRLWKQMKESYPITVIPTRIVYDLALLFLLIASVAATSSANLVSTIYGGF